MTITAEDLLREAAEYHSKLVEMRRELHSYPELSWEEHRTTRKIRDTLTEAGISILPLAIPVGVLAEITGAAPGPTVALRADIDALPIQEESGLPRLPHLCDFGSCSFTAKTRGQAAWTRSLAVSAGRGKGHRGQSNDRSRSIGRRERHFRDAQ